MRITNYITVKEYAEKHNVTESAVRQRIFRGVLPHKKIGTGNHSINLIKENEPWIMHKPGVKPKSKRSNSKQ